MLCSGRGVNIVYEGAVENGLTILPVRVRIRMVYLLFLLIMGICVNGRIRLKGRLKPSEMVAVRFWLCMIPKARHHLLGCAR